MKAITTTAIYEDGVLKLTRRLPFREDERLILQLVRKPDPVSGKGGLMYVFPEFARDVLAPRRRRARGVPHRNKGNRR